jgi:hypothetical protein
MRARTMGDLERSVREESEDGLLDEVVGREREEMKVSGEEWKEKLWERVERVDALPEGSCGGRDGVIEDILKRGSII